MPQRKKKKSASPKAEAQAGLVYEGNPKHKVPWQAGRRGSLCPKDITAEQAQEMLRSSTLSGKKRYAVDSKGRPFAAQAHAPTKGRWHGYPVAWKEVPGEVRKTLQEKGLVSNRQVS